MPAVPTAAAQLVDAVAARDFDRVRGLLGDAIDFRGMTPRRIWEAEGPDEVIDVLREWLADPDEPIDGIEPTEPALVQDTARVGWLVRGSNAAGPMLFEQQAYVREQDGKVAWLRVICSGPRPR